MQSYVVIWNGRAQIVRWKYMIVRKGHFTINDLQRLTDDYAGCVCDSVIPSETAFSRPWLALGSEAEKED